MGKTALQMRADLRLDLKDSGALWSNAELDRSIERAVADFNRYLPDEKTYELSLQFSVSSESVTFPAVADPDRIVANADLPNTVVDGSTLTIAAQPDAPRPLVLTITNTSGLITNLSLIVRGSDKEGKALEETFHYYKGLTTVTGKKYFKTVNEVETDQIDGNVTGDKLDLGIGAYTDVWVYLANAPVKQGSESGTDAASNSLTRNTDYYIDYIAGALKAIASANIAAGEACTFDYTKMQIGIDLSALAGLIRVQRVEYPVGHVPQNFIQGETFGRQFFITGMGEAEEQQRMAEGEHVRIYYDAEHLAPNDFAPGTIPSFLENTVATMAGAYALYTYALKSEHQAATDLASARTELGTITHAAWGTALTNAATQVAAAATALGKINSDNGRTYLTDADGALNSAASALAKVATYLETNDTTENAKGWLTKITTDIASLRTAIVAAQDAANSELDAGDFSAVATHLTEADAALDKMATYLENNTDEDSVGWLTKITTDIAGLRTAILTAQDAANSGLDAGSFADVATHLSSASTALDKVATYLENNTDEDSKFWLTKITTDIAGLRTAILTAVDALNAYLDSVATDLTAADDARANYMGGTANYVDGGAAPDVKKYLDDGDALLNTVAVGGEGAEVPRAYREFAQATRDGLVTPHEQDRRFKADNATKRTNAAMGYANEVAQRLSNLRSYIEQADAWGRVASGFVTEAVQRVSMAARITEREMAITNQATGYINEAASRLDNLRSYIEQASGWNRIAESFAGEAAQRVSMAARVIEREVGITSQAAGYVSEAASRLDNLRSYVEQASGWNRIADSFANEATQRIAEAAQRVGIADRYLAEAMQRNASAEAYVAEANSRLADIDRYISEADRYVTIAAQNMALADRFRTEADERRNEVYSIWRDRKTYIGDFTAGAVRQMPSYG